MFNYLPSQWMFLFYFYSFCGWVWESLYVSVLEKRLVNRGFMRGPFLPLYGCGGVMMLVVSKPFYDRVILVYVAGCLGATLLELITGILMETLFKVRYWDYHHKKFNFMGYTCLESTLFWGVCTVVFTHYLQLPIEKVLLAIPLRLLSIVTIVLTALISFDFMIAFKTALELRDILMYMEKAKAEMQKMQKRLDGIIAFGGEVVRTGIGNRVDAISSTLESTFSSLREKMRLNPAAYVGSVRDEVGELYVKYRVIMSRFTPPPVKSFFDWYRNRTIAGNPTMVSKFKSSLDELKEKAMTKMGK
ncbi:putative ABC transporter permease [Butyrivibrio sp. MC2021]|uniref:putative ABC transporter permease n=1 Tax=Butyrivibrio sp. MC2021 TaxID=1408306 RepID=UPI000479C67E|nr:putative ABC transporter permease [Butyrivibrio sp. MC2021]